MRTPTHGSLATAFFLLAALLAAGHGAASRDGNDFALALQWPEEQRAFFQDGPGLLLSPAQLEQLTGGDVVARQRLIEEFLDHDPIPETPANELRDGIRLRQALVAGEFLSLLDDRAKLLFLHGVPSSREVIDCVEVFKPLEIWSYPKSRVGVDEIESYQLLLYRPKPGAPYRLWLPIDSKRTLYNEEMEYFLQQWEENKNVLSGGKRFDKQLCDEVEMVDLAAGIDGLFGFMPDRPKYTELQAFLEPPGDLGAWAARAAAGLPPARPEIPGARLELAFPERHGQRMETQFIVVLEPEAELGVITRENESQEMRVTIEGEIERRGEIFETFRMRFFLQPTGAELPVALIAPRRLRPQEGFVARLRVIDEITEREVRFARGFVVPSAPMLSDRLPAVPPEAIVALGDELKRQRVEGFDSLILVPPESDVVFGLWRADVLVTGSRIARVIFFLDEKQIFKRSRPPFSAELRLPPFPVEQIVRAEGYDAQDELVASDEVVLNQPRGQLKVRILDPPRGNRAAGSTPARVEVVVPEERKVTRVVFLVNEVEQAVVERPPWTTTIEAPGLGGASELNYLTVIAELDDGSRAEDVRFLNPPAGVDEIDVNLVELYTTVTDKSGRLVKGLAEDRFQVFEDDRPQRIVKFELVDDLPLTLGITIDTSGSMFESLEQAKRAAVDFLDNIITPKDLTFALAFADRPVLLMPRTSDVGAVEARLENLLAHGTTSLHDAVVTSLYYFRGIRGRRALVVLSDGEDTASTIEFPEALEYARISGVAIYSIGLRIGKSQIGVRRKLESLAEQTGGRTFYIHEAAELHSVYDEIEEELRSQYLVAYNSDQAATAADAYREVRVEVSDARGRKLQARTIRGYYP